ncbi:hypothetical protein [Bradyrhizobium elkanii]|jgi:hypothetical protein|uniref:hypothetical protein n=1 Tax=Bradyrhizobium elkanii TaxID=29448 RepID=UPI001449F522|nr:hypothetical protein [Bradyrhizobium elkanii]MCP1932518.1 hypothetical protein [Bradyrhizobium elkanii]MCS3479555.1 hypothetical protein [Bradyrhizobium elkanii]MCS3576940.1 hypothetical protein [Bradyrhizobium elkanii]MCS3719817.1 hypothetical protein [Bradyrhizobium elkanii]MCS4004234.1 hypothetical protein [Bradyrhizobium elkanii USDA 61]
MRKAKATYNAPEGDNKVVEMGGVTFFHGQEVELNSDDHGHLMGKLENNPHFDIDVGEDDGVKKPKRGRPSNAEKAAKAEAEASADPVV